TTQSSNNLAVATLGGRRSGDGPLPANRDVLLANAGGRGAHGPTWRVGNGGLRRESGPGHSSRCELHAGLGSSRRPWVPGALSAGKFRNARDIAACDTSSSPRRHV